MASKENSRVKLPALVHLCKLGYRYVSEKELEFITFIEWIFDRYLPDGILLYYYSDQDTGEQKAIFDLAWPTGIQDGLSQPVALLLNESKETLSIANQGGFRCFTSVRDFKKYVNSEILNEAVV